MVSFQKLSLRDLRFKFEESNGQSAKASEYKSVRVCTDLQQELPAVARLPHLVNSVTGMSRHTLVSLPILFIHYTNNVCVALYFSQISHRPADVEVGRSQEAVEQTSLLLTFGTTALP